MDPAHNTCNQTRLHQVNQRPFHQRGRYVLYWMQLYRRLDYNHALNHALALAERFQKPLVIYEGLKLGYPWASQRLHRFILEGMQANRAAAATLELTYWPFVETPAVSGRGLLRQLAADAVAVVTDDHPGFIIPGQTAALAAKTDTPVIAVDGNSIVPLALLGPPVAAAAHLRPRIHRAFAEAWQHRAGPQRRLSKTSCQQVEPPFPIWEAADIDSFVKELPLAASVPPVAGITGGTPAAQQRLQTFIRYKLSNYAVGRSHPLPPEESPASGLSPYLHFGHISIEEVVEKVLASTGNWSAAELKGKRAGKRAEFYCADDNVNSFLDEAITWRDVGFQWHRHRAAAARSLDTALPAWALATLHRHANDRRDYLYTLEQFEAGATHDDLWNAAQKELAATGTIHNYLRMLWGKKVVEWSATPAAAYSTLEHLNNKYALDGRDPNSYTGILWCFGLFDRPWPERPILGTVRYMSSENTAKKFRLGRYLEYVAGLGK